MKRTLALALAMLAVSFVNAQIKDPVKWSFSSKKIDASTYEVHLTAYIDEGWHVYSQFTPDGGPEPTVIQFAKNPLAALQGPAKEMGKMEQKHEPLFGVDVKQFSDKVVFVQEIKVKGKAKTSVSGTVVFMSCNDQECLPPKTRKFSIALK